MNEVVTSPAPPPRPTAHPRVVLPIRLVRVAWRLLPALGLLLLLVAGGHLLGAGESLRHQLRIVGLAILAYATARALVFETLAPEQPSLRMVPMGDVRARRLAAALRFLLAVLLLTELGIFLVETNNWYPAVTGILRLLRNLALLLAGYGLLAGVGVFRWLRTREVDSFWGLIARFTGRLLVPLALVASLFQVVVLTLGYVPLGLFVSTNLIESGIKLIAAVISFHYLNRALGNFIQYLAQADEIAGEPRADADEKSLDLTLIGLERVAADLLRLVIAIVAFFWILAGWEITPAVMAAGMDKGIFGSGSLTWGRLLGGLANIAIVIVLSWLIRSILTYIVFPRANAEVGARYALLAVLKYLTWALVGVFVLDAIGLDVSSLGWFFGAAGVGIGLGLQDVIGNFVSGLIMLIERPIRVGDVVQVGDVLGTVEDIRIRGTVIRTFDNTAVTIPNRQMLGERVTNMSYAMQYARVKIEVGVAYEEDPKAVEQVLLDIAQAHPDVLDEPAPSVILSNFGPSSVDLTLICHTGKVTGRLGVSSTLRYQIFEALKARDIRIPFPQMDVHVTSASEVKS